MANWSALSGELTLNKWKWNIIEEYLDAIKLRNLPTKIETLVGHNTILINVMDYDKRKPKHFEAEIIRLLPEIHTGYYGDCRGSNRFEECKNVILFGRFALRDSVKWLLSLYGLSSKEIKSMEQAEEIQALHRVRPLLDKEFRIFLFTNTLKDKIPNATEVFNKRHLDKCLEILARKEELEGLTKTELYNKLKGDHNDIKR